MNLTQQGLIIVAVPLLFQVVFVTLLMRANQEVQIQLAKEQRSKELIREAGICLGLVIKASTEFIDYNLDGEKDHLERYVSATSRWPQSVARLEALGRGAASEKDIQILASSSRRILHLMTMQEKKMNSGKEVSILSGFDFYRPVQRSVTAILRQAENIVEKETPVSERARQKVLEARKEFDRVIWFGLAVNILLSCLLALSFGLGAGRRARKIVEDILAFGRGESPAVALEGKDEFAVMDQAIFRMSAAVKELTRRERSIIANASDVICSLDESLRFEDISPSCERVLGYTQSELVGMNCLMLVSTADKDGKEKMRACFDKSASLSSPTQLELRLTAKDKREIHILWSIDWSVSESRYFCVLHDITERKLVEEQLRLSESLVRLLIESMPVGFLRLSLDGRIMWSNARTQELFERSAEELEGLQFASLFEDFPGDLLTQPDMPGRILEFSTIPVSGRNRHVELCVNEVHTNQGKTLIANMLDVTERNEIEKLKRQFVAMASHELRTPLTSIGATMDMLKAGVLGPLPEPGQLKVERARANLDRLISLVNALLSFEKMQAGALTLECDCTTTGKIVDQAVESLQDLAIKEGVTLTKFCQPVEIFADEEKLVQVVVNFLSNAIKFSPVGSMVTVGVREEDDWVEFYVKDQGPGIAEGDQRSVFEAFFQTAQGRKKHGTGLGLSISKAIIEAHGGTIGLDSKLGGGAEFYFRVPIGEPPAQTT
jgi:PAS domain S-box-containing protein